MRLLDQVAQAEGPLIVCAPHGKMFSLPGAAALSAALRETPLRYVLDDGVAAVASILAFSGAAKLSGFLDLARLPAERLWIEWDDAVRAPALQSAGAVGASQDSRRAGVLISSDAGGRKGVIRALWANGDQPPDLAPAITEFDLDDAEFASHPKARSLAFAADADADWLGALFRHARFAIDPAWREYYAHLNLTPEAAHQAMIANCLCVAADFPFILGLLLVLQARNAVAFAPTERQRLNRARVRRGKPELLDYTEVFACLDAQHSLGPDGPGGRLTARRHFVSGHLVRRGGGIFWRRSHLRGSLERGVVLGRNINLRLTRNAMRAVAA